MENRVVCFYCGTIYDAEEEKCPLCGGKTIANADEAHQPVQRRRITEQERKQRRRSSKGVGKFAAANKKEEKEPKEKGPAKTMLIAALVFLALAVVALTWFIGDMIGWWGGLEDSVQRESQEISVNSDEGCTVLELSKSKIQLYVGQTDELELKINSNCNDEIQRTKPNENIAVATLKNEEPIVQGDYKSDVMVITAISKGTTKMEFSYGDTVVSCEIVVSDLVELSDSSVQLEIGQTCNLQFSIVTDSDNIQYAADGTDDNGAVLVTYPDPEIAEALETSEASTANGDYKTDTWLITAISEGTTKLEFRYGEYAVSCNIIVIDNYEPELNVQEDISLYTKGETVPLSVKNLPEGATVTWTSSDETVAKVDENGVVTAMGNGTATITAQVLDKTAEVLVRCPFDQSGDIDAHLSHEDVTIGVGETFRLSLLDSNNERIADVTYEMSKDGICSIEDGKVKGLKSGTVTVTVVYNAKEYKCIVRVR